MSQLPSLSQLHTLLPKCLKIKWSYPPSWSVKTNKSTQTSKHELKLHFINATDFFTLTNHTGIQNHSFTTMVGTWSHVIIHLSRCGTFRWRRNPLRLTQFTSICGRNCARCMKTIVFSTSLSAVGMATTRPSWLAPTTISSGCLTGLHAKKSHTRLLKRSQNPKLS